MIPGLLIGTYEGNGSSGTAALPAFEGWFGRAPDIAMDFSAFGTAAVPGDETWWPGYWTGKVANICSSVPLATGDVSLAAAGAGGLDAFWIAHLTAVKAAGFAQAILRPGWEFNGGWYPWGNLNGSAESTNLATYIAVFRRFAGIARSILPACKLLWCWCGGNGLQLNDIHGAYPGDDVVDVIGPDVYARAIAYGEANPPAGDCEAYFMQGWQFDFLDWVSAGNDIRKPFCIPELGIGDMPVNGIDAGPGSTVGATVAQWLVNKLATYKVGSGPGELYFVGLWDYDAGDDADKVSTGERPAIAAIYRQALGPPLTPDPRAAQVILDVESINWSIGQAAAAYRALTPQPATGAGDLAALAAGQAANNAIIANIEAYEK